MTNEKYWSEICRVLHENGIHTGTVENSTIPILLDGGVACRIQADGCFCYRPNDLETEEAQELRRWVAPFFKEVSEYISLMEKAPLLNSTSGNESYRLLADFNGVILAGKEMALGGYQFATWDKDASGNAYSQGNYFINGYVSYHGTLGIEELMMDDPAEQGFQMGGLE